MDFTELILNNEGEDYRVVVSLDVANLLLNDPDAAKSFIQESLRENHTVQPNDTNAACSSVVGMEEVEGKENQPSNILVWTSKKPSRRDLDATELFLQLRQEYSDKFDDKKTVKNQLWQLIATKLNQAGYYVGEGRDAVEKCRVKFANMQKQYIQHIQHMRTTGEGKKNEPLYFAEMHSILGKKDKVNPKQVQDSLDGLLNEHCDEETQQGTSNDENENVCPNTEVITNRFRSERSIRPKSANSMLVDLMKEQHTETLKSRNEEFKHLSNLLETQNQQRERFLNQFERLIDLEVTKKRKTCSSPESD